MKNLQFLVNAVKKNQSGFTLVELLVVIGILGVIMFIFLRGFIFGATANDYASDMSLDVKGLTTNVFRPLKAQDPWSDMADQIGATNTWVTLSDYTVKTDGITPNNVTARNKLGVYAKQFDGSLQNIKKWSAGFEKTVKFRISKTGPAAEGVNMQGKTILANSITNNTTSILEVCMQVDKNDVTLPAGKDGAICVATDMGSNSNVIAYSVATMP